MYKSRGPSPEEYARRDRYIAKHPELGVPNALPMSSETAAKVGEQLRQSARLHGKRTLVRLLVADYFDQIRSTGDHQVWGEGRCTCRRCGHRRGLIGELSGLVAQVYES